MAREALTKKFSFSVSEKRSTSSMPLIYELNANGHGMPHVTWLHLPFLAHPALRTIACPIWAFGEF
jgi:hypothetical protein